MSNWNTFINFCFKMSTLSLKLDFLYQALDYWSKDMLNFNFLEKGLGMFSPPHFVYGFSSKIFPILYSINWTHFIVWFHLLFEILSSIFIANIYFLDLDVIKFEFNLLFVIKPFFYMTKNLQRKFEYLEEEKSF